MNGMKLFRVPKTLLRSTEPPLWTTQPLQARRTAPQAAAFFHKTRPVAQNHRPRYGTAQQPPPHLRDDVTADDGPPSSPSPPDIKSLPAPKEEPASSPIAHVSSDTEVNSPLESVLDMDPPSEAVQDPTKPPHLQAPPYVHHFDSWTLVRDLQGGGFSQDQAVTLMKAIRTSLAENIDLARRGLVSKSNVENELYLFRAACSELKTEIQNNRRTEGDTSRSQRGQLAHEVDSLGQEMTQEVARLKDGLRGEFDDQKMGVRMEHKQMEAELHALNSKIAVVLNSDARGDVEGVRWVLTRRAALAIAIAGGMVLGTLNYARYMMATQEAERKKHARELVGVEEVNEAVKTGTVHGLAEEVLLAPEGVSGG